VASPRDENCPRRQKMETQQRFISRVGRQKKDALVNILIKLIKKNPSNMPCLAAVAVQMVVVVDVETMPQAAETAHAVLSTATALYAHQLNHRKFLICAVQAKLAYTYFRTTNGLNMPICLSLRHQRANIENRPDSDMMGPWIAA
jgi:hypothetical protein